jgi:hypothetical protein
MTAPSWMKDYKNVWLHPQHYLGDIPLSAVVVCPDLEGKFIGNFPNIEDINMRLRAESNWVLKSEQGCQILLKGDQ